jgi:hypothetical protein
VLVPGTTLFSQADAATFEAATDEAAGLAAPANHEAQRKNNQPLGLIP